MTALGAGIHAAADAWLAQDPDPDTRAELARLTEAAGDGDTDAAAELDAAFAGPLTFGTAGLRGRLGPGPGRMNRVVVAQAAAGLAGYLHDHHDHGRGVVIGFDARHKSDVFARDTAEILAGAGFSALLLPEPLPTPVLAFAIKQLGCAAGVMVTASHNPRDDNGYKVYLGDGIQIVPPADEEISRHIRRVAEGSVADLARSAAYTVLGPELVDAYLAGACRFHRDRRARHPFSFVYTPLHGVGGAVVPRLLELAGFPRPPVAPAQAEPDPDFPTAPFPNPEEAGALDPAYDYADECGIATVIANDPDADRCAVALRGPEGWARLTGDQVGALLGADAFDRGLDGTYAASIVSSTQLAAMAGAHGRPYAATLTGFKWIARAPGLVYGYEEALGYCCDPELVSDKDGMTALLRLVTLGSRLAEEARTFPDLLDDLDRAYGVHATDQLAVRVEDVAVITEAMRRLRAHPPDRLAAESVAVTDLAAGSDALPPTDAVLVEGPTVRVVVRPSGTEPKLKCYLQVRHDPTADLRRARATTAARLAAVREEMAAALGVSSR